MTEHIVGAFDAELKSIAGRIAKMGGVAEALVSDAVTALMTRDVELAKNVIARDVRLDRMQHDIETSAIQILVRRQPMAQDLRDVVAAMRIVNDLERVGDLGKNIAKRVLAMSEAPSFRSLTHGVEHLAESAAVQLHAVLDAFSARDVAAAHDVHEHDNEVDALYTSLFRELLTYMMEDPRNITSCAHLLFCAKNIERIGDHATNIAETIHYMVTGRAMADERRKVDEV